MGQGVRDFLQGPIGRYAAIGFCVIGIGMAGWMFFGPDGQDEAISSMNAQVWIDLDGNVFMPDLKPFEPSPNGPTGKKAFRAELCAWTKDGKTKPNPTPVLLNSHKGLSEPTFCPDCGRLVVPLNALPVPGIPDSEQRVPPTQQEYEAKRKS